jgi:ribosome-binding protein aMBF1 (putative translation factor)
MTPGPAFRDDEGSSAFLGGRIDAGLLLTLRYLRYAGATVRELYQHIGEKLRLARIAAGLSHAELALEHKLTESEVRLIELGEHLVSAALLWEIAITLEISINELFPSGGGG